MTIRGLRGDRRLRFEGSPKRRRAIFGILAMAAGSFLPAALAAPGEPVAPLPSFDKQGNITLPTHMLPQSDLVSPEFKAAYAQHLAEVQHWPEPPKFDAPKAQWDAFDKESDRLIYGPATAWALATYKVDIEDTHIAGVHVGIVKPKAGIAPENRNRVLINLHGGGFGAGRGLIAGEGEAVPVAATAGIKVVTVDYRQAPYYRFPAASEDVEAVYRALLRRYKPGAIGIFGCSAGGVLTGQAVARIQHSKLPRPGAAGIFCSGPVPFGKQGDTDIWGTSGIPTPGRLTKPRPVKPSGYMEGARADDPLAYPGASDKVLAAFPPVLLLSGTRSYEMSWAAVAHAKFLKLGVDSSLYIIEGSYHGAYHVGAHDTPEARDAVTYIGTWFMKHLAR